MPLYIENAGTVYLSPVVEINASVSWLKGSPFAFFFWILTGFKGTFQDLLKEKFASRNLWTGYLIQLIIFGLLFYFLGRI